MFHLILHKIYIQIRLLLQACLDVLSDGDLKEFLLVACHKWGIKKETVDEELYDTWS